MDPVLRQVLSQNQGLGKVGRHQVYSYPKKCKTSEINYRNLRLEAKEAGYLLMVRNVSLKWGRNNTPRTLGLISLSKGAKRTTSKKDYPSPLRWSPNDRD